MVETYLNGNINTFEAPYKELCGEARRNFYNTLLARSIRNTCKRLSGDRALKHPQNKSIKNQNNSIMNVTIESFFCSYNAEVTEAYLRLINTILFAVDEDGLRQGIEKLKPQIPLDDYFVYGFGEHHLWVHQRKASDRTKYFEYRLMKAEF